MTHVVLLAAYARRRTINRTSLYMLAAFSLVTAVLAAITLGIGLNMYCHNDSCEFQRSACIISGSLLAAMSVWFLILAICLHIKIKRAMRAYQSGPAQHPVTVSPEHPVQRVISFPVMPTQDPPPYSPPTGPMPYPLSPPTKQDPPQAGFVADSQSTESFPQDGTQPPPYSP